MIVTITFHGPFSIATGTGRDGVGATVDRDELLPATSLKGVMRASARRLLEPYGRSDVLDVVFGAPQRPSPWHWGPAEFSGDAQVRRRARVALDPRTGTARRHHLVVGEEVVVPGAQARFSIDRFDALPRGLSEEQHLAVLACAAAGVHELGGGRSRGLGWVSCTTADPAVDDAVLDVFEDLLAEGGPS